MGRKETVTSDPVPASFRSRGASGGGTMLIWSTRRCIQPGMIRGRFFGLPKNSKTCATGNGIHCSNCAVVHHVSPDGYLRARPKEL